MEGRIRFIEALEVVTLVGRSVAEDRQEGKKPFMLCPSPLSVALTGIPRSGGSTRNSA